jgi:hypothetical protein
VLFVRLLFLCVVSIKTGMAQGIRIGDADKWSGFACGWLSGKDTMHVELQAIACACKCEKESFQLLLCPCDNSYWLFLESSVMWLMSSVMTFWWIPRGRMAWTPGPTSPYLCIFVFDFLYLFFLWFSGFHSSGKGILNLTRMSYIRLYILIYTLLRTNYFLVC